MPKREVTYSGPMPQSVRDYYNVSSLAYRSCCVYILTSDDGCPVYVGMSHRPGNRFDRHRAREWWPDVAHLTVIEFTADNRSDARWAAKREESRLIASLLPYANRSEMPREATV